MMDFFHDKKVLVTGGGCGRDMSQQGQPRRCLDVSRARERFGFVAKMGFAEGLGRTIEWYEANHPG